MEIRADFAATVWKIPATAGDSLQEGEPVIILESMKMEIPVVAPTHARVIEISIAEGDPVEEGQRLAVLEPIDSTSQRR